jgi:hypothetical protein
LALTFISLLTRQLLAGWTCVLSWAWAAAAPLAHAGHVLPLLNVTQAQGNYGQAAAQIASAALTGKSSMSKMDVPSFCFMAGTRVQTSRGLEKIESLHVGGRVLADESAAVKPTAVRAGEWRRVEFTFADPHSREGKPCRVVLLRSAGHVAQRGWRAGAEVKIDFGEEVQRAEGRARIVSITPAAAPEVGAGQVVTGTFQTWHRDLRELWMEGLKTPVRVTSGHRFYSASREAWVEAHHLRVGETVRTRDGAGCRVRAVLPLPGEHEVFNIEVETAHQYHVTTAGLLTHNNGGPDCGVSSSGQGGVLANKAKVEAVYSQNNGPVYYDANGPTPGAVGGDFGLRSQGNLHAETGAMAQANLAGERGGTGNLLVDTTNYDADKICQNCLADIKTMGRANELDELNVTQISRTGETSYRFDKEGLKRKEDGGSSWEDARVK